MKKDLTFGFSDRDIVHLRARLEPELGVKFEERESSHYGGRYFRFESPTLGQFIIQENFDAAENEWIEECHQDLPLLLNVSDTPNAAKLKERLSLHQGCRLLNEIVR